jgi:mRNA interferase RelE/StbE
VVEYSLTIKPSATKELEEIADIVTLDRLIEKIKSLSSLPRPPGSEKLAGRRNLFRIRQGNYRIVYSVDDQSRVVNVVKVGHRRDVYR